MKYIIKFLYIATLLFCWGCTVKPTLKPEINIKNLVFVDKKASPKNDFYRFVNGKWIDGVQIPDSKSTWGGFNELRESTDKNVLKVIQKAIALDTLAKDSDEIKPIHLYKTILDTVYRNEIGVKPILKDVEATNSIADLTSLQKYLTETHTKGKRYFFSVGIYADAKDSNKNVLYLNPGQLGLPDRDYYISDDEDSKSKKEKYQLHIATMLNYLDLEKAQANTIAKEVVALETEMANIRMDKVDRRNPKKRYNPMSVTDLAKLSPSINWTSYFETLGIKQLDSVVVSDVTYFKELASLLKKENTSAWKSYCKWLILRNAASKLSTEIETKNWEFYGQALRGSKSQEPKEKIAVSVINRSLGEALGKLYVKEYFPPAAKKVTEKMIQTLVDAYEIRINALEWMNDSTKVKAIEKLKGIKIKVGYPNKWKDYSQVTIKAPEQNGNYYSNLNNIAEWSFQKRIEKLNKPVDKTEWFMAPQVVNAYYNPPYNEIVFPAAILQKPFFDFKADPAINFGGIGAVIGHEISHGFDDSGANYDAQGNLSNWWTDEDLKKFKELGSKLADQFGSIQVLPRIFINGKFTLGENIGDLGGVNAAYDALQLYLQRNGPMGPIDGFSQNQRFFMSWTNIWRTKMRDDALKTRIKTDPHSPGMYRATQPLLNIQAFYDAFEITEKDKMFLPKEDRVSIW